jgi:hypothetical protein
MNASQLSGKLAKIDTQSLCSTGCVYLEFAGKQSEYRITFKLSSDPYTNVFDFDCYGRLEWATLWPQDFDGGARIIQRDRRGNFLWWQPYKDEDGKIYDSDRDRSIVRDLVEYGFYQIELKFYGPLTSVFGTRVGIIKESTLCGLDSDRLSEAAVLVPDMINDWVFELNAADKSTSELVDGTAS